MSGLGVRVGAAAAVVCVGLLGLFAGSAFARRRATASEKAAIAKVAGGRSFPASCAQVYISTADATWASFVFVGISGSVPPACEKWGSNGVTVLHVERGRWRAVTAGSDFQCPIESQPGQPAVPRAVVRDLILPYQPGSLRGCT